MKKVAGRHPQSWCKNRFTHGLCTGFRFDNAFTLKQICIDFPESEGKIEILCSCTCHDRADMQMADLMSNKIDKAFFKTLDIFGTTVRHSTEWEDLDKHKEKQTIDMWGNRRPSGQD